MSIANTCELPRQFCGERMDRIAYVGQLSEACYQRQEESWMFARNQLPVAYQMLFRSTVCFGYSIVDPQLRIPRDPVVLHNLLRAGKCITCPTLRK